MFVRELTSCTTLCNSMQLVTQPLQTKNTEKGFLLQGACWSHPVAVSHAVSPLWPYSDPVFTAEGQSTSQAHPAIINSDVTRRCLPGALWLGTWEAALQPDPAVGMHSAAGRLHRASTVPPSPCQPPGPAGKTKDKLFPCCLATTGKAFQRERGRAKRERACRRKKKKTALERIFFVVIYLIQLKDYSALSR